MKEKSILVTGCAGFIGANFARTFKKRFPSVEVVGLDDFSSGRKDALDPKTVFYKGSILDRRLLDTVLRKHRPEYVFHFAAMPRVSLSVDFPTETTHANIGGTVTLFEAARDYGVKRIIFSSSSSVYGGAKKLPTKEKENGPNPVSPYALQKYVGELFARQFSELFGLDVVCLRYFNVYGPGQYGDAPYSTVISAWLEGLYFPRQGKRPFIEGDGRQSRDFAYVDNVVDANIKAMQFKGKFNGEIFNIAQGERTSLLEVKRLIEAMTGRTIDLEKRPNRKGDVRHTHADISKARKWFGYNPKIKFKEGLRRTIAWYEMRQNAIQR